MPISERQLDAALRRAVQIARDPDPRAADGSEAGPILRAAEEAGIPREAALQALREEGLAPHPVRTGELVFARSADGYAYVAEVVEVDTMTARVRFLRGGEHRLAAVDIRPLEMIPGRDVEVETSWGAGLGSSWESGTVDRVDEKTGEPVVTSLMASSPKRTPLEKLRLAAPAPPAPFRRVLVRAWIWAGTIGATIGFLAGLLVG